jgi:O-antigen/teichoic acid export membrane protein
MDDASAQAVVTGTPIRRHLASPLYRNAYFLILGAGAGTLLGFLFWTLAARKYSAETVGLSSVLISAMMIASGACQLGLGAVLFRYLPSAGASTRTIILRSYALTAGFSALVGGGVAFVIGMWVHDASFLHRSVGWLVAFVVATVAYTIATLQDSVLTGLRQARWVPLEQALFPGIKIFLLFPFVGLSPRAGIFLAWCLPVLLSVLPVNLLIFGRLVPRHLKRSYDVTLDRRTVLRLAVGNYLGTLFLLASSMLLPIIVAAEVGSRKTAYFYIPWSIAVGLQLVALNMTTSLTVEVAYDESKLREYCRRVTRQTMRIVVPVVAILILSAHYVLLAFGNAYAREGATCLRLLALSSIPNVIVMVGISVARIHHDGRMALLIPGAVCVLTVGLSLALLPNVGIAGVGWSLLASQVVVSAWLLAGPLRSVFFARA